MKETGKSREPHIMGIFQHLVFQTFDESVAPESVATKQVRAMPM